MQSTQVQYFALMLAIGLDKGKMRYQLGRPSVRTKIPLVSLIRSNQDFL